MVPGCGRVKCYAHRRGSRGFDLPPASKEGEAVLLTEFPSSGQRKKRGVNFKVSALKQQKIE